MSGDKRPLFQVEGRDVYYGDELHVHPLDFRRAGHKVRAYRPDYGSGEVVVRSDNGAVPTLHVENLSWAPHPETIALTQLEENGFEPTLRNAYIWMAAERFFSK